jgi:uncharacterized protein YprB with RNaseH-like and TPR domain
MVIEVFFDVETKKLFSDIQTDDPADLGVSVVSVYRRVLNSAMDEVSGEMKSFWDQEAPDGPKIEAMWPWFAEADRIVGFNSRHFDVPALRPYYRGDLAKLNHFDIMDAVRARIGRKLSLNALVKDTLGSAKTDVGTHAVLYWANRDPESLEKLRTYCEMDVALTRDLYDYGRRNKYLRYTDKWNNQSTIEVDFSYPAKAAPSPQIDLF